MPLSDPELEVLLKTLGGSNAADAERAWAMFLDVYSTALYGVVRSVAKREDHIADCFLFVCERLSDQYYRRLRKFEPNGRARFSTWLNAVCRNLVLDWHRAQFGRRRLFRAVSNGESLDREIFRMVLRGNASVYDAWQQLSNEFPGISYSEVERRVERLHQQLSSRQLWLLSVAKGHLEAADAGTAAPAEVADQAPNPEEIAVLQQTFQKVSEALGKLTQADQLLLRLRYEEELGFREVAALVGLKDAQTADRRIREALARLREKLGCEHPMDGKQKSASV